MLVEVLASSVAGGLVRLEQEKAVLEADARFRQFFTPELSRQLTLQPDLLSGRQVFGQCLFCHVNRANQVEGPLNRYRRPVFDGHAIGCQRCHGPGELHASAGKGRGKGGEGRGPGPEMGPGGPPAGGPPSGPGGPVSTKTIGISRELSSLSSGCSIPKVIMATPST